MTNVKRITLIALCLAATLPEGGLWAQQTGTSGQMQASDSVAIPARWDLQSCIDYALQQTSASVATESTHKAHRWT